MAAYQWFTRCIPAFSICAVILLLVFALILQPYGAGEKGRHNGEATIPQVMLSFYTVFLHLFSIAFPARAVWAMSDILRRVKDAAAMTPVPRRRRVASIKNDEGLLTFPVPLFVIILPAYKEDMDTLETTLKVLASHPQARHSYHIYLAMEEKEEKSAFKAATLCSAFEQSFYKMSYTIHPSGIPGEAQGKSSNESWAAKQASEDYPDQAIKKNIVMTVMDADTHLSPRYFQQIARMHTEAAETNESTIYVPPLIFDRNLHRVPLFVRTADLMWAGAGMSSLYAGSTVGIPTSVYSVPMTLVEHVGGWDTGPGAIGEDMHMYLKCFFALSGNLTVQVVYAPASQCNVSCDAKGLKGYFGGLSARYNQALRHMWGSLDSGFAIRESIEMFKRHRKAHQPALDMPVNAPNNNWTAYYTSTGLHKSLIPKLADTEHVPPKPIHKMNLFTVYHRLFEAHFLPTHLAIILATTGIYDLLHPTYLVPRVLRLALDISGWCRLIGFLLMICFFYLYSGYHHVSVGLRQEEMRRAGMLEDMSENDSFTPRVFQVAGIFEAAVFPIGGFAFGAIPALQAVLSHLFTEHLVYVVSLKPQLAIKKLSGTATP